MGIEIKQLVNKDKENAFIFVKKVFIESKDESYSEEGIETFNNFVDNREITNSFKTYGAFENNVLKGVIALDKRKRHINFFFVDKLSQGKGIGKELMNYAFLVAKENFLTVNSSRYAVPIYEKFGFVKIDTEQTKDGLVFTPMKKVFE